MRLEPERMLSRVTGLHEISGGSQNQAQRGIAVEPLRSKPSCHLHPDLVLGIANMSSHGDH